MTDEEIAEAIAKANAERDERCLAAHVEYSTHTERFARSRALNKFGIAAIAHGAEVAAKKKETR